MRPIHERIVSLPKERELKIASARAPEAAALPGERSFNLSGIVEVPIYPAGDSHEGVPLGGEPRRRAADLAQHTHRAVAVGEADDLRMTAAKTVPMGWIDQIP